MLTRTSAFVAALALGDACNPFDLKKEVKTFTPDALAAGAQGTVIVAFNLWPGIPAPKTAGLMLKTSAGAAAAALIKCIPGQAPEGSGLEGLPAVLCPVPADGLAPGSYPMSFSGDASCGPDSYKDLGSVDVIEPAHIQALQPSHGPSKQVTNMTIVGTHIGGPRVFCEFSFPPGDGAKFGCSMTEAGYPAWQVTSTSASCTVPAWPGPLSQYDGHGGFVPVPGAVCAKHVNVRLTNDARVSSLEPIQFSYDDLVDERVLV